MATLVLPLSRSIDAHVGTTGYWFPRLVTRKNEASAFISVSTIGMVYTAPETPYMSLLRPFLLKKKEYALDAWGCDSKRVANVFQPIEKWMLGAVRVQSLFGW